MLNSNTGHDAPDTPFLWDYLKESGKKIVLFGTGDGADKVLQVMSRCRLKPVCFTATGDFGMKPDFRGYKVLPFHEVERLYKDFIILLCFGSDKPEVLAKIAEVTQGHEVYAPDLPVVAESEDFDIYSPDYIAEHGESLEKARKLFAKSGDKKSLEVFDGWLEYRLGGKLDVLERIASPREEMLAGLKLKSGQDSGEFFIDAGAFRGDTVEEFLQLIGYNPESAAANFAKIIAIEPDIKNHTLLRRKFYAFGTAIWQAVHGAAWNADESLTFSLKSGRAGHILRRDDLDDLPYKGRTIEIPGVRIDSLVGDDDKVTFIKIDVEGAERQVLEGAKSTITRCRPKMLVSLYHRCEDMFELPLLLHSYYAGYKFALRKTHCVPGWEFQLIVTK